MTGSPNRNVVLAFDFGLRRVGLATGNLLTGTATPLGVLDAARALPWDDVDTAVDDWRPGRLVVGLPSGPHASEIAAEARAFATALERRYGLPVATTDEQLTSMAAESRLRAARASGRMKRRVRKGDVDSGAACIIAEQWMSNPS